MEIEDYEPNSHKYKSEQQQALAESKKKPSKVISGTAKVKKRSEAGKFADAFISEDAGNIKSYILMDILVPTIKNTISDIVKNAVDMFLGIDSRRVRNGNASRISYGKYYEDRNTRSNRDRIDERVRYDEVILDTRGEAESVLIALDEIIETYGMASIADFYDLVGVTGSFTDNKYGWTNLRSAKPIRTREGWIIKFPKAVALD